MDELLGAWAGLVARVGGVDPGLEVGRGLLARWGEAHRRYHDREHLAAVLRNVALVVDHDLSVGARHAAGAGCGADSQVDVVLLAVWYHDAVYEGAGGGGDESASARLAGEELARLGVPGSVVREVVRLVELTAGHDPAPGDVNGAVLCDADLAVLAGSVREYDRYAAAVREEYRHVPDEAFRVGRAAVLSGLAAQPALFRTPYGRARWDGPARENLRRELAALGAA